MPPEQKDRETPPNLLFVLAHGVGRASFTALRAAIGCRPHELPLAAPAGREDAIGLLAGAADATPQLRDLGVEVDRSSVVLRPAASCDAAVVSALAARARAPAPVTVLELRSVLDTAVTAGEGAARRAVAELAELVAAAADALTRAGGPTETWLVGLGEPVPVARTFDFAGAWRRSAAAPLGRELSVAVGLDRAHLRAATASARDLAVDVLRRPPFRGAGVVADGWDGPRFLAEPGVAFGSRRVLARPPHPHEAAPVALLPRAPRAADAELDLRGLIARFWMRAAAHAARTAPEPQPAAPAPATVDDVRGPLVSAPVEPADQPPAGPGAGWGNVSARRSPAR